MMLTSPRIVNACVLVCLVAGGAGVSAGGFEPAQQSKVRLPRPLPPWPPAQWPAPVPAPPDQNPPPAPVADDLFDPTQLHEISLTINSRDWQDLKDNYRENTYYVADLRWRGHTVRNIGIRSRGKGTRNTAKPGLRVDFDRYSTSQEFLGLKSIVLDNMVQDPTMLKERIAMQMFREMGIAAPRVVNARLMVNNQYVGLYAVVESVDKKFLKRNFGQNDGYLYEYKWGFRYGFEHLGSELERYAELFEPRTHESASMFDLYRPILDMTWAISESSAAQFPSVLDPFLDVRKFLTHVAVEGFLAEHDGIIGESGMNNFYLYRFEGSTRFQLVPWDKDYTFQSADYGLWDRVDTNALMARAMTDPSLHAFYTQALRQCAEMASRQLHPNDPDAPRWLEQQVRDVYAQIRSAGEGDPVKPYTNEQFNGEISRVIEFARIRAAFVLNHLAR